MRNHQYPVTLNLPGKVVVATYERDVAGVFWMRRGGRVGTALVTPSWRLWAMRMLHIDHMIVMTHAVYVR